MRIYVSVIDSLSGAYSFCSIENGTLKENLSHLGVKLEDVEWESREVISESPKGISITRIGKEVFKLIILKTWESKRSGHC